MARPGRSSGRSTRLQNRDTADAASALHQMPWGQLTYIDKPTEPLDEEGVNKIHDTAMRVLEEVGILFLNEEARDILKEAGCDVDPVTFNVKFDRNFVMEMVARAPESFSITPRNPARKIEIGNGRAAFGMVASPPNTMDLEKGRRVGNRADYQDMLRLSQAFNCINFNGGYPVEPIDIHASIRHLDAIYDLLTLTDKVFHAYSLGPDRVEDAMEMARIGAGLTHAEFDEEPRMFTNINSSSPLKHDWPMLDGAMRLARRRQPVIIAPFTLAGAMAPVTIVGSIVQQTAECLAAVALLEYITPGTPVVFGAFTSNVDMKSGSPAFGTPEYMRAMQISGQMARFYKLPWRGSNANASNAPDGQAIWESQNSLFSVLSGHCGVVFHAAGWVEGGLSASFEKVVMDCEMIQQWMYYNRPIDMSDDELGLDAMKEVGPNGHFFGCQHTQSRYRNAFYNPFLSDWRNYEAWAEAGSQMAHERAHTLYKEILAEYTPPPIDLAIKEELEAFVARRKEEGGAPTDF
ncbi:MAG TPA: methyltransferase [Rhodospirillaceae bacterium]|nr:methyltransferase [Rhodospirillaceae bacterium]MAX62792.1 methyltransferase [Rhodospirillaceae bacterium]MBB57637.1 methyltransferase [Rhodospirillaceae bacterium]HBM12399.1 methyltransferase [Rhodospirillaceae bacterium]|tara:strand:+ start:67796 stop:69352 length:1557 start_codon:yes stop_codon:yes gene_type:complete